MYVFLSPLSSHLHTKLNVEKNLSKYFGAVACSVQLSLQQNKDVWQAARFAVTAQFVYYFNVTSSVQTQITC